MVSLIKPKFLGLIICWFAYFVQVENLKFVFYLFQFGELAEQFQVCNNYKKTFINNQLSKLGLIKEIIDLSCILLAVVVINEPRP